MTCTNDVPIDARTDNVSDLPSRAGLELRAQFFSILKRVLPQAVVQMIRAERRYVVFDSTRSGTQTRRS